MKRLPTYIFGLLLLIAFNGNATDIYVSPNGSDNNAGTIDKPLATLTAALRNARELRRLRVPGIEVGIHIILRGGVYFLSETVFIRPEDSGTGYWPTYIEAAKGEVPVLSGGVQITGWKKLTTQVYGLPPIANDKVWEADLPSVNSGLFEFRQLWVNNKKAVRAKSVNGGSMDRILSWNKADASCWIPLPKTSIVKDVAGMEMFIHQWWAIAILRIKKMDPVGDSAKLTFLQPESRIQNEHPWPAPWISKETGNSAFYLTNAIQFLDEPGEWFLDIEKKKLYYWPRADENLSTANVISPILETLVSVQGNSSLSVSNIYFKGISFEHTGWLRPSKQGHVPHQAGMYMLDAYALNPAGTSDKPTLDNQTWVGRPAAAVSISRAAVVNFDSCRFEHLASTGLDYNIGVRANAVTGNLFKDIGGTAILAGVFSDEATEIHLPYYPKDDADVCDNMQIINNLVTDAANEDWSCAGIGLGYTRNSLVERNEIENVSNSGISMGWGWNPVKTVMEKNTILSNSIHHFGKHNYDCGGIYALGAQPGSRIMGNYVDSIFKAPYAHLPSHWFYLYADEGSTDLSVVANWTPSQKYLQNANGPDNNWAMNGPEADARLKTVAGLEPRYQSLLKERTASALHLPINEEHNEVIEIVVKNRQKLDSSKLKQVLARNGIYSTAIYQWQNHYVIFDKVNDIGVLQAKLREQFPQAEVRPYYDLFYQYRKQKNCADKTLAKEWDHIILTADMVADPQKQREYLNYHATQFEQWPEVANGFCNANFQQLLLFRNGRQLMLIISIPKGESLDKLNPLTTANNPRVVEWNNIMKQYQQGIAGTKKNEVWVILKKVNE